MNNQPRHPYLNVFQGINNQQVLPRTRVFIIMFVYIFVIIIAIRIWGAVINTGNLILLTFAAIITFVIAVLIFYHCCFSIRGQGVVPVPAHDPREFEGPELTQMIHRAIIEALNERNTADNGRAAALTPTRTRQMVEHTLDQLKNFDHAEATRQQQSGNNDDNSFPIAITNEEATAGGQCTICLEEYHFGDRCTELRCGHVYHRTCLVDWMVRRNKCPLCSDSVPILPLPSSPVLAPDTTGHVDSNNVNQQELQEVDIGINIV